ncbi:hypothetical protein ATZ33_08290 [Enterococcus silesiacus]|uniref:Metallo-beta-lactamase superfamily protein n=1 Tax=Enterococcus silesiacus TaxID=332949 RepID=A0A0S3KAW0_9ENTE|nr:hypothetical protein [Enterococcus silesiacus]ALS01365.1 hypothetical protein ATZ33_08290 [Enterococcus silesiacus]OJG88589.1 metallo-beta-lactamase superfamily protein [Enterococcus silesiacus]
MKKIIQTINGEYLTFEVLEPDKIMNSSAVLIHKNGKALLVNTQFSNEDGREIVALLQEKQLDLKQVIISYSDPDFYFGLDVIQQAFPDIEISATETTIERIKKSYSDKLTTWEETLKDNTPAKIVLPNTILTNEFSFEGEVFQLVGSNKTRGAFYEKNEQILFGSIDFFDHLHIFLADTPDKKEQQEWLANLLDFQKMNPKKVIPAHFSGDSKMDSSVLDFTKNYIEYFMQATDKSSTAAELIKQMTDKYPTLQGQVNLELSAKVVKNELSWNAF